MPTFTTAPDFGYDRTIKPRVKRVSFADGYEQRSADGINTQPRQYRLSFNARTTAEADVVDSFLIARDGVESFDWTPPDGVAGKFVCREWTRTAVASGIWNMSATFEEVFES